MDDRDEREERPLHESGAAPPKPTVVGIGASAGGLAALKRFIRVVPADSGLAFVVVVHLAPEHESHLADLLQPHSRIPVQQVTEAVPLDPNHVYVIPPNANLNSIDTHLRLSALEERRRERAPIDHFFRTLASTHDGSAIGVILTGTGSDGTLGAKDIKAKGGLVIVQDPNEAEYGGMPQSAIATGLVDLVLPVEAMPEVLVRYDRTRPPVALLEEGEPAEQHGRVFLQKVFAHLRARTERDFSRYKRNTVLRRITRRMQISYIEDFEAYLQKLRDDPDELHALADDLLITVTHFFRDAEVFERLEQDVIPRLFESRLPDAGVRAWSVGCATGEEAYSIAMLLVEAAGRLETAPHLQVFASDLHRHSLEKARDGLYPGDIAADVSAERLRRFFRKENGGYRIAKEIRDLVVFAPHNLLADPPFSRLDLISCRNLLIYLQRDVQRDVIDLFHYALNPNGYLVLGSSETLEDTSLFRVQDKKLCVYQKRNVPPPEPRLPVFPLTHARLPIDAEPLHEAATRPAGYGTLHERMVELYAPPSVLVTRDNRIVHLSEHAGRYLVHPGGEPTAHLLKLVREELRTELRTALHAARERGAPVDSRPIPVGLGDDEPRTVVLHVRPAPHAEYAGLAVVIFEERDSPATAGAAAPAGPRGPAETPAIGASPRETELETDLTLARQRLQATVEEFETSQEEMRASNEEMQSTNEELRSTMEELETSKEELQSINEELQTVNQENRHKLEELAQLTGDLHNLLAATDIATLFLDRDLRILRFTPRLGELFNVRVIDQGRAISDLTNRLGYAELQTDAAAVLSRLVPVEREVRDEAGRWYLTRVLPYRSSEDRVEGVVINFIDITTRRKIEDALRASEERLRRMMNVEGIGVRILDSSGRLRDSNDAFARMTGYGREEIATGTLTWRTMTPPEHVDAGEGLRRELEQTGRIRPHEIEYVRKDGSRSWMLLVGAHLGDDRLIEYCIDVTDRKRMEQALSDSERLHELVGRLLVARDVPSALEDVLEASIGVTRAAGGFVELLDPVTGARAVAAGRGVDEAFLAQVRALDAGPGSASGRALASGQRVLVRDARDAPSSSAEAAAASAGGYRAVQATPLVSRSGRVLGVLSTHYAGPYTPSDRELRMLDLYARQGADLLDRARADDELRRSEERYRLLVQSAREYALFMLDLEGRISSWNAGAQHIFGYVDEQVLGQPGDILFTEEDQAAGVPQAEMEVARREGQASGDRWQRRRDGSHFWAGGVIEALRGPDGELRGFVRRLRDNTERRTLADAQQALNDTIDRRAKGHG